MSGMRDVTAHHEAGHAVAAVMRGGPDGLRPGIIVQDDGLGLTPLRMSRFDEVFIAYAGLWAEGRYLADQCHAAGHGECEAVGEWDCREIHGAAVILNQPAPGTGRSLAPQYDSDFDVLARCRDEFVASVRTWDRELERVWPVVCRVATWLIAGMPITGTVIDGALDECSMPLASDANH